MSKTLIPLRHALPALAVLAATALLGVGCDVATVPNFSGNGGFAPRLPGAPSENSQSDQTAATADVRRDIEEADIVKIVGDKLYALNTYKGLLIIDVSDPDQPALLGQFALRGRGVEMYVIGTQAYVLLSADVFYAYPMGAEGRGVGLDSAVIGGPGTPQAPAPDFEGSQLAIIDVTTPVSPTLRGKINLAGFANESRRVGNVIYVIGGTFVWASGDDEEQHAGFVASVNVADPENILAVDRKTFSGQGLVMHASETALFAASQRYDFSTGNTSTRVQAVDISNSAGDIALRGTVDVPGAIRNRFYLDAWNDALRIVTESTGFGFRRVKIFTYNIADLDAMTTLGEALIIEGESLETVRFDGPRGYAVTFLRVDPLFVLDLADPATPVVAGHLEVPGYSTHIEPRGNRLIAVGIDDTDGQRPAVSYYNVEDPAAPAELGRVILGPPGSFTESEAVYDEKAFKIIDELGLIAMPFKHVEWSYATDPDEPLPGEGQGVAVEEGRDLPSCVNAVQLVDFSDTGLEQRGWFEHRGRVQRVGVVGTRVFALSQAAFQTVDITNRDAPVKAGEVAFFSDEDMPFYADDCDPGIWWTDDMETGIFGLWRLLLSGQDCGVVGLLPAAILPLCLFGLRAAAPWRRNRRS